MVRCTRACVWCSLTLEAERVYSRRQNGEDSGVRLDVLTLYIAVRVGHNALVRLRREFPAGKADWNQLGCGKILNLWNGTKHFNIGLYQPVFVLLASVLSFG